MPSITLARRLANYQSAHSPPPPLGGSIGPVDARGSARARAERVARTLGGTVVIGGGGSYVRIEAGIEQLAIDRGSLGRLPGHPGPDVPLICLDTETTGLGTAVGTLVFLVGLGWWEGAAFRRVQLVLPDEADEAAFLEGVAELIPRDAWLVTYNGRGFDWPLLVTRYRMGRRTAPPAAGHLDLLPFVRGVFRHRLQDARLRTVERSLLGVRRTGDVESWQIPGIYLDLLRGGPAEPLRAVARHNDEDVRSLARLLAYGATLGDPVSRLHADQGDLIGLARGYGRQRRHAEALACLDAALAGGPDRLGWRDAQPAMADRRRGERLVAERARTLRRLGRLPEALETWLALAAAGGSLAATAWIEAAKGLEWHRHDIVGALGAAEAARALAERSRQLGRPLPILEGDLLRRRRRLMARMARRQRAA